MSRRFQISLRTLLPQRRPVKRGYIGGFFWAFFGDSGHDGMSWEPIIGCLIGGVIGWLTDKAISPHAFILMGSFSGMLLGAAIVAVRVADEPRPTGADRSGAQQ